MQLSMQLNPATIHFYGNSLVTLVVLSDRVNLHGRTSSCTNGKAFSQQFTTEYIIVMATQLSMKLGAHHVPSWIFFSWDSPCIITDIKHHQSHQRRQQSLWLLHGKANKGNTPSMGWWGGS